MTVRFTSVRYLFGQKTLRLGTQLHLDKYLPELYARPLCEERGPGPDKQFMVLVLQR